MTKLLTELLGDQADGHAASIALALKYIPFYRQRKPERNIF